MKIFLALVAMYLIAAWLFGLWPMEEGILTGPSSECAYDAGYQAGYDGATKTCKTEAYLEGYGEGDFDSECDWLRCDRPNRSSFKKFGCGSWSAHQC